ncbi:hypothetical protein [Paraflavitalea pollutisoli]|uniref:hypothetical protein n=1 Tax=Paraflavitalea pollutisoli TaxID=3034143 RepID=UPI0023EE0206|nr:hypothetical protein [Paraflavitalea sp. H1-2-19X]
MRRIVLVVSLIGWSVGCLAQQPKTPDVETVTKVTILNPGIGYEHPIGHHQTLYLQGMFSISGSLGYSGNLGWLSELYIHPALSLEYRYYFGWKRRLERGKRVALNSANYLAGFFRTDFPERYYWNNAGSLDRFRKAIHALGVTAGMQRNYRGRFSLDLNIGFGHTIEPGYTDASGYWYTKNSQFYFPGRLSLGIWLNKRK